MRFLGSPWPGDSKKCFKMVFFRSGALGESLGDLNRTNFDQFSTIFDQFSTFFGGETVKKIISHAPSFFWGGTLRISGGRGGGGDFLTAFRH